MKLGRYYLLQFGFIYPYLYPKIPFLCIFNLTYLHLPLFTYIRPNIYDPYLVIFALSCPDLTICAIFTLYMYSSIETAPLCQILEQSGQLFMAILHVKELGDTESVVTNAFYVFIWQMTIICMYLLMFYPCIKF